MSIIGISSYYILNLLNKFLILFRRNPNKIEKIVIYLKGGIGDFTFLIPVLYTLKHSEKKYVIHLVVSKNIFNIVNRFNDYYLLCNEIRIIGTNSDSMVYRLKTFIYEAKYNLKQNYDLFFDAWPAASMMIKAVSIFAITKTRVGIENKSLVSIYNNPIYSSSKDNVVKLNAKVLTPLGINLINKTLMIPINESEMRTANQKIIKCSSKDLNEIRPFIVLYPHTQKNDGKNKHWKSENYIEMINSILKEISGIRFLIMGSKYDYDFCNKIFFGINPTPNVSLLAGNTTIFEDCFISSKCVLYIGIDGGFTHLVNTLNIPSIVLWGPTSEKIYGSQNNYTINVSADFDYVEDGRLKYFYNGNQEDLTNTISPSVIVNLVKKMLGPS